MKWKLFSYFSWPICSLFWGNHVFVGIKHDSFCGTGPLLFCWIKYVSNGVQHPSKSRGVSNFRDSVSCGGRPLQGVPVVHNCDLKLGTGVGQFDIYFFLEIEKQSSYWRMPHHPLRSPLVLICLSVQQISTRARHCSGYEACSDE